MVFHSVSSLITSLSYMLALFSPSTRATDSSIKTCRDENTTTPITPLLNYGVLLYRAFELMDVFGPLEILQLLTESKQYKQNLFLLSRTLAPVTTEPAYPPMNPLSSSFWPVILPTHTFADDPDLDVLIVPGGAGERSPDLGPEVAYLRHAYPKLRYLITVCTGAGVAARAGVLDGRRATTSKYAWGDITPLGNGVKWVAPARWVVDGNIWTSSGVTAGLDLVFAFINVTYPNGPELTTLISGAIEHKLVSNSSDDPFAARFNVPTQNYLG
ncbi:class I glutamine amidotransferase-like protein [Bombardia bombarda]|uniref:Class I glutamine amidotransferase-like protein n=1 Tax=Bombardia bombarda TaxID=252184 RepID=A0AA40CDR1_9PEZI|nr:class I glutamine amidotransferase-like protein [Bombardia bombarda]